MGKKTGLARKAMGKKTELAGEVVGKAIELQPLYEKAHLQRMAAWVDTNVFDFHLEEYAGQSMIPMFCTTANFNSVKRESDDDVMLLDLKGNNYKKVKISRTDFNVWPFHPSTIFTPDGLNQHGVVWVTAKFFDNHPEIKRGMVEPKLRPKWPAALGTLGKRRMTKLFVQLALELDVGAKLIELLRKKLNFSPKLVNDLSKNLEVG